MNIVELKKAITDGALDKDFSILYQDVTAARARYIKACDEFVSIFGDKNEVFLYSAPGRTEVGGNHTDHQHGRVLAGSVDLDIIGVVAKNNDGIVRIKSEGFPMDEVSLSALDIDKSEFGHASALIRGMCANFKLNGHNVNGFDAYTTSSVMKGSGLSSSAAFEVFIGTVMNYLFNDGRVDAVEIAKISQKAESIYFGKPCGLLDQSASALGGFTAIDFKDPTKPVVEKVDFDLSSHGYVLCVVNTGGNHANLTQDYADITVECRDVSNYFNKDYLRDVDQDEFFSNIAGVKEKCGDRAVLRAIHFFAEDQRAEDEKQALKNGNFSEFLRLINESGNSSYKYLQNVYSTSAVNEQGLCLGLALTEKFLKGRGACRVHGGGFAGTIQCFIPSELIADYKVMIEKVFGEGSCYILKIRPVGGYEIKA
ncbi:MAG: galactokinase family protein [Acutalibacteraceae bacterium]|nr:galactokinase family protein [Acutalibacteraceae bacterium]